MSITEYRVLRRRATTQDCKVGVVRERTVPPTDRDPEPPELLPSGSQRLEARVATPLAPAAETDGWSTFDADTADILLPELALPPDEPWMPVASVRFGDQHVLVVHRGVEIDLVLPNGQRLSGTRESAIALATALVRGVPGPAGR